MGIQVDSTFRETIFKNTCNHEWYIQKEKNIIFVLLLLVLVKKEDFIVVDPKIIFS